MGWWIEACDGGGCVALRWFEFHRQAEAFGDDMRDLGLVVCMWSDA